MELLKSAQGAQGAQIPMEDTFSDYLSFMEDRPHIFKLDACETNSVSLNCWDLHIAFTDSAEGQTCFYNVLDVSRQLAGIATEIDKNTPSGIVIRECDIVHMKHLLDHMRSFTPST